MKYLLDTCTISDYARKHAATLDHITQASPKDFAISSVTEMEVHYGFQYSPERAKAFVKATTALMDAITILPFDSRDAQLAGELRAALRKKGTPIGPYDLLIAATAINHNLTLVSANTKEFERISQLSLVNWRKE
tara:strand:- start:32692 stop:33096 length:405 start_codon:yes stop_codon:yes gene_type:complete